MFKNSKPRQVPPCSCCGRDQLAYESFYQLDISRAPRTEWQFHKTMFVCPKCFEKMSDGLTLYQEEIKREWSPVQ